MKNLTNLLLAVALVATPLTVDASHDDTTELSTGSTYYNGSSNVDKSWAEFLDSARLGARSYMRPTATVERNVPDPVRAGEIQSTVSQDTVSHTTDTDDDHANEALDAAGRTSTSPFDFGVFGRGVNTGDPVEVFWFPRNLRTPDFSDWPDWIGQPGR